MLHRVTKEMEGGVKIVLDPPYSVRKLCVRHEKRRDIMSVQNPDEFVYSWIHDRFTLDRTKKHTFTGCYQA